MDDAARSTHDTYDTNSLDRPAPTSCRMIDFETADVLYDSILGYPAVIVHGEKPYAAMTVELRPRTYVRQPEYWEYEVVGCLADDVAVPDVTGPYAQVLPLPGASIGSKGIEIVGANRTQALDIDMSKAGTSHNH